MKLEESKDIACHECGEICNTLVVTFAIRTVLALCANCSDDLEYLLL